MFQPRRRSQDSSPIESATRKILAALGRTTLPTDTNPGSTVGGEQQPRLPGSWASVVRRPVGRPRPRPTPFRPPTGVVAISLPRRSDGPGLNSGGMESLPTAQPPVAALPTPQQTVPTIPSPLQPADRAQLHLLPYLQTQNGGEVPAHCSPQGNEGHTAQGGPQGVQPDLPRTSCPQCHAVPTWLRRDV